MDNQAEQRADHAICVTAIDGLATLECGIGSVVNWFFESYHEIEEKSAKLQGADFDLYAISPEISFDSSDFNSRVFELTTEKCEARGGKFVWFSVPDSSSLNSVWSLGDRDRWVLMCRGAANEIAELSKKYRRITVLVHGIMLTAIRAQLEGIENVDIVFVAHSLGRVFDDAQTNERAVFEDEGFAAMNRHPGDKVAYIGNYFRQILLDKYDLDESKLVPFINSIYPASHRFSTTKTIDELLTKYGIPRDRKLAFSWGRCTGQKGRRAHSGLRKAILGN